MNRDLRDVLDGLPPLACAFSGGLDSRFLLACCLEAGHDVVAVHVTGPHIPAAETRGARDFARVMGARLLEIEIDPLSVPEVARTDRTRCYHCKKLLIASMRRVLAEHGEDGRLLCDGSNHDDQAKYRPGLRALAEEGVCSPLARAGLSKRTIAMEARAMGFPLPAEQARPCLLTRYAYGLEVRVDELRRLERAEEELLALTAPDGSPLLGDFRLRLTPGPVLQVQRLPEESRRAVDGILRRHGFHPYATVRTDAVSGFFDAQGANAAAR